MPIQLGNRPKGQPSGNRGKENTHVVLCQRGKLNRNGAGEECRQPDVALNSDDGLRRCQCGDHHTCPTRVSHLAIERRAGGRFGGADHVGFKTLRHRSERCRPTDRPTGWPTGWPRPTSKATLSKPRLPPPPHSRWVVQTRRPLRQPAEELPLRVVLADHDQSSGPRLGGHRDRLHHLARQLPGGAKDRDHSTRSMGPATDFRRSRPASVVSSSFTGRWRSW